MQDDEACRALPPPSALRINDAPVVEGNKTPSGLSRQRIDGRHACVSVLIRQTTEIRRESLIARIPNTSFTVECLTYTVASRSKWCERFFPKSNRRQFPIW